MLIYMYVYVIIALDSISEDLLLQMPSGSTFDGSREMIIGLGLGFLFSAGIVVMLVVVIKCLCSENSYTTSFLRDRVTTLENVGQRKKVHRPNHRGAMRVDMLF